jgi:hypothetical protein
VAWTFTLDMTMAGTIGAALLSAAGAVAYVSRQAKHLKSVPILERRIKQLGADRDLDRRTMFAFVDAVWAALGYRGEARIIVEDITGRVIVVPPPDGGPNDDAPDPSEKTDPGRGSAGRVNTQPGGVRRRR